MNPTKPGSHLSAYEKSRRETAQARRQGIAKYLPEAEIEPLPELPEPVIKEDSPRRKRVFLILLASLLCILLLVLLAVFLVFHHFYSAMNIQTRQDIQARETIPSMVLDGTDFLPEEPPENAVSLTEAEVSSLDQELAAHTAGEELFRDSNVYNILLLGVDAQSNLLERTDAMILVSINKSTKEIYLTSFLRDIYLHIPDYGSQRLNAANVVGGPTRTMETIEQNFGISINNYAAVNFDTFSAVIDILGGVDIYLSAAEASTIGVGSSEGSYHLDGKNALYYCRIRKLDSDFGRSGRQRKVLESLWTSLKDSSLSDATNLLYEVLPQVTTDLSQSDCLSLLAIATQILDYDLVSNYIPAEGTYQLSMVNGMSVIVVDMEENSAILKTTIYGK